MRKLIDITGQRFGRLIVVERSQTRDGKNTFWKCVCDCGNETVVSKSRLNRGETQSCGCLFREFRRAGINTKHGLSDSPEYFAWSHMIYRCENPRDARYHRYGARGIRVCESWRKSFHNFYADMGPRPSDEHSIDRIDNNGNYEPENCRWATNEVQIRNTVNSRKLTAFGRTQNLVDWADETGIDRSTIAARIDRLGWSVERAVSDSIESRTDGERRSVTPP